jgi:hypothetical protein
MGYTYTDIFVKRVIYETFRTVHENSNQKWDQVYSLQILSINSAKTASPRLIYRKIECTQIIQLLLYYENVNNLQ